MSTNDVGEVEDTGPEGTVRAGQADRTGHDGPLAKALLEIQGMYSVAERRRAANMCISLYKESRAERARRNRNSGDK